MNVHSIIPLLKKKKKSDLGLVWDKGLPAGKQQKSIFDDWIEQQNKKWVFNPCSN